MRRRSYLVSVWAAAGVALGGCLDDADTGSDTNSDTDPGAGGGGDSPIDVDVWNQSGDAIEVRITVTGGSETLADETVDVDADDQRDVDSGITETGSYDIRASVDGGPSETFETTVEEFDLDMGSAQIVEYRDGELSFMVEE